VVFACKNQKDGGLQRYIFQSAAATTKHPLQDFIRGTGQTQLGTFLVSILRKQERPLIVPSARMVYFSSYEIFKEKMQWIREYIDNKMLGGTFGLADTFTQISKS